MSTLTLNLADADKKRLAEIAAQRGVSVEEAAASAVKAQIEADAAARKEVEAGLLELDAGDGLSLEDFEREMDGFMRDLPLGRG
jgi:predicted transcriptional regulator